LLGGLVALLVVAGAVAFVALRLCRGFDAVAPEGFARFDDWCQFRAVSPDGVMYRVRTEENDPPADLDFWREALKKRMTDAGYKVVADGDVEAGQRPGYLLDLAAPVGQEDYSYLVAVFVDSGDLIIAEAAGEVTRLAERRDAVIEAIRQIE
jgi:hypothetical protein